MNRVMMIVFGSLVMALCALPAPAQLPLGAPGVAPQVPPLQIVGRYLELSPEQVEKVRELVAARRDTVRPLNQQIEENNKALRDQLESGSPNATAIGTLAIENHGLRRQIDEALQQFHKDLESLLDETQVRKLRLLRQAARLDIVVHAARELGIV